MISPANANYLKDLAVWDGGTLYRVDVSDDESTIAAYFSSEIRIYNADTLEEINRIDTPIDPVFSKYAISGDGRFVAHVYLDSLNVWEIATGMVTRVKLPEKAVCAEKIEFSKGSQTVALISFCNGDSSSSRVYLYRIPGGLSMIPSYDSAITGAFSPDGKLFAVAYPVNDDRTKNNVIILYETQTGRVYRQFDAPNPLYTPVRVAFSPNGSQLLGIYDRGAQIWQIDDKKPVRAFLGKNYYCSGGLAAFFNAGSLAYSANCQYTYIWNTETGTTIFSNTQNNTLALAPNGSRLVQFDQTTGAFRLVEIPSQKVLASWYGSNMPFSMTDELILENTFGNAQVRSAADGSIRYQLQGNMPVLLPNAVRAVTVDANRLRLWDLKTGDLLKENDDFPFTVEKVSFTQDGKKLVEYGPHGTRWVDLTTFEPDSTTFSSQIYPGKQVISEDQSTIARINGSEVEIYNAKTSTKVFSFPIGLQDPFITISGNGAVVGVNSGRTRSIWDANTGKQLVQTKQNAYLRDNILSPDGQYFLFNEAGPGHDQTLNIWTLPKGDLIRSVKLPIYRVKANSEQVHCENRLILSPDRHLIGIYSLGEEDCNIELFSLDDGKTVGNIEIKEDGNTTALSPAGDLLVTDFRKAQLNFWDVKRGEKIVTMNKAVLHEMMPGLDFSIVSGITFSPDGRYLAVVKAGRVHLMAVLANP